MNCDDWRSFLHDYVLGDLSDSARQLLDRHAESCPGCLGEAGILKFVDRRLREEPSLEPPPGLGRRALESAPARSGREIWRVAAGLLLAGGIGAASVSAAVVDQLPDDLRSGPRVLADAARFLPELIALPLKE